MEATHTARRHGAHSRGDPMRNTTFTNDMTMMYVMHDALRRELRHLTALAARTDVDPREVLRTTPGWELFTTVLHAHHGAEDDALWPGIREAVGDDKGPLALLDAMDAEHAMIEPGLAAVEAATAATGPAFEDLDRWGQRS